MSSCGGCGKEITVGKILSALDQKWHPECFKCDQCGDPITGGSFSIRDEKPICSKCANLMTGNRNGDDDDGPTGKDCGKCGEPLQGSAVQGLTGGYWHPSCFTCFHCDQVIDGSKGFIKDKEGNPLHGDCAKQRGMGGASAGERCGKCGKELLGSCVTAMDKSFHKECFVCSSCKGSISSGYLVVDGLPYCKDCHNNDKTSPMPDNAQVTTTTRTKEVVIQPEKKNWLSGDDGSSSRTARDANKKVNRGGNANYGHGDTDWQKSKPKPKPVVAKPKPASKPKPAAKSGVPAFCGECGTKSSGGRFCGECGFKFY